MKVYVYFVSCALTWHASPESVWNADVWCASRMTSIGAVREIEAILLEQERDTNSGVDVVQVITYIFLRTDIVTVPRGGSFQTVVKEN